MSSVKGLDPIVARIESELDEKDRVREATIKAVRGITRLASAAIRGMHTGQRIDRDLAGLRKEVAALHDRLRGHPEFWFGGTVEGALQEAAEAAVVHAVVRNRPLPRPDAIGVTPAAYVLGLGDAIGELRRFAVDMMRLGRMDEAGQLVDAMEDVYHAILRFDYPDAIVAVRHKQDVARSLLERTRGELAVSARSAELEKRLARLTRRR